MGADLYQVGKTYPDGYFRDSYNNYSVMWQIGLSWWRDVVPMLNRKHELTPPKIKALKAMVESRQIPENPKGYDDKPIAEADHNYFVEQRQKLIAYLDQALTEKRAINCSL